MMQWKDEDELTPYTPEDAAKILGISDLTLRNWLRAGRIKGIKVGREWRILKKNLEEYLRTRRLNTRFTSKEHRTKEYENCVELMDKMSFDQVSMAYAEAAREKIKNEFTEKYGVEIIDYFNNPALGHINSKMKELWEISQENSITLPGGDHLEILTKGGRGYALVSHPYGCYGDFYKQRWEEIEAFCEERDLEVSISCDSWYFPGKTLLIIYTSKDKPLLPKDKKK